MKSTMRLFLTLTLTAASMGAVLALVHQLTAEPIAASMLNYKIEALTEILPDFDNNPLDTEEEKDVDGTYMRVYTARRGDSETGKAVETRTADGFSGEIVVMVGFGTDGAVTGYKILQHAETPGLGAKAHKWFSDPTGHRSIIGSREMLKVSKDGGEIDGITAATITSRAFLGAVNKARQAIE